VPLSGVNEIVSAMGDERWLPRGPVARESAPGACEAPFGDVLVEVPRPAQVLLDLGADWHPVVECDAGTLIAMHHPSSTVLVADPDLFANHGLPRGDHAEILLDLVEEELGAEAVIFDEAVHGFRRRLSLLAELARPPLVIATLHGAFVLGLVLWAGMGRFGKPQPLKPALETGKQALIENTAQLLVHGGHTVDSLARYYRDTLRAVAAHHQISADLTEGQLVERLQAIAAAKGIEKTLHRWRTEMTRK